MSDQPDPEIQELLDQMKQIGVPNISSLSVEGARNFFDEFFLPDEEPEEVENVRELSIAEPEPGVSIDLRVYYPESLGEPPHPVLVYYHGGGWVIGNIETHDPICRAVANEVECVVVSVEYRLAPEHKFPAAVEDSYTATRWVSENADVLHVDPDRLAIGGDSAGGNLAAVVALMARDRGEPDIGYQVLVYPATSHGIEMDSYEENAEGYFLETKDMHWFWNHYLRDDIDQENLYASPLKANDLSGLPPATVITANFDPLRDEGERYAKRLKEAGVPVELRQFDGMIHGFFTMVVEPDLSTAREAISLVSGDLQTVFS